MSTTATKKSVVIVGGGHAGTALARALSTKLNADKYNLLLINPRPFSIWLPAMIRVVTSDKHDLERKAFMPFTKLFEKNGTVLEGRVTSIKKNEAGGVLILDNGEEVRFDILVVATGSIWEGPLAIPNKLDDIEKVFKEKKDEMAKAKSVILIGGGAIGIEYAGEIKDVYPNTEVTIVHAEKKLLNGTYPDKFRNRIENDLRARGVNLVLGDFVENTDTTTRSVSLRSGKQLNADLIIPCRGGRPNTHILQSLGQGTLNEAGYVKVNKHLQLSSHTDVFALGDIIEYPEQKQAGKVQGHAGVVADNILTVLGERAGPLKEYKGNYEIIVLTNGKNGGVSYFGILWGLLFGNWVTKLLKAKSLLVPLGRKAVGLTD